MNGSFFGDTIAAGIVEGWRARRSHPIVFPLLAAETTFALFGGFFSAIYMLFTLRTLGLDEATVGIIIGVGGALVGCGRAIVLSITLWTIC